MHRKGVCMTTITEIKRECKKNGVQVKKITAKEYAIDGYARGRAIRLCLIPASGGFFALNWLTRQWMYFDSNADDIIDVLGDASRAAHNGNNAYLYAD